MRLCFSVNSELEGELAMPDHFGESSCFVVFDTVKESFAPYACDSMQCRGTCQCHLPAMQPHAFDVVICRNIGARAFALLRRKQIDVYLTQERNATDALNIWRAQQLPVAKRGACRPEFMRAKGEV